MITTSASVSLTIDNPHNIKQIADDLKELGLVEIKENQTIICAVEISALKELVQHLKYSKAQLNKT